MNIPKSAASSFSLFSFVFFLGACSLQAGIPGKSFVMRNSEPVIVSNTLLSPGTHIWRLMDSSSNLHIVQITNEANNRVEALIQAIPKYRKEVTSTNEVQFWETPVGFARAVHTWFTPGDNYGQEFLYSKKAVLKLGRLITPAIAQKRQTEFVRPASRSQGKVETHTVSAHTVHPSAQWPEGSWAIITDGAPAMNASAKQVRHADGIWDKLKRLPMTATIAPLIGLIGVGFLVLFFLSHSKRKNRTDSLPG